MVQPRIGIELGVVRWIRTQHRGVQIPERARSERLEAARRKLEETDVGVDRIAADCGFGSAETLRRAFVRNLRVAPAAYRSRFRRGAPATRAAAATPAPRKIQLEESRS